MRQLTLSHLRHAMAPCALVTIGTVLGVALWASPAISSGESVVSTSAAASVVDIQALRADGGVVSGALVNKSSRPLRDVQLLIRYAWIWKNERSPGRDNPGRSAFYTAPGEIAPGGSLPFTYRPAKPLPKRTDGSFDISAQVVGFTEIGE